MTPSGQVESCTDPFKTVVCGSFGGKCVDVELFVLSKMTSV